MPIEIRELVIRAIVADDAGEPDEHERSDMTPDDIVDACVTEVLRILRRSEER